MLLECGEHLLPLSNSLTGHDRSCSLSRDWLESRSCARLLSTGPDQTASPVSDPLRHSPSHTFSPRSSVTHVHDHRPQSIAPSSCTPWPAYRRRASRTIQTCHHENRWQEKMDSGPTSSCKGHSIKRGETWKAQPDSPALWSQSNCYREVAQADERTRKRDESTAEGQKGVR